MIGDLYLTVSDRNLIPRQDHGLTVKNHTERPKQLCFPDLQNDPIKDF